MYAYFKGYLEGITDEGIVVEVNGIGYNIRFPKDCLEKLPSLHSSVQIYTYTSVREDALQLYGFLTLKDLEMFKKLITVNGIGPKVAQGILSVMDADTLSFAIISGDVKMLSKAQGVGNKSAERIILDLKDKISLPSEYSENTSNLSQNTFTDNGINNEVVEALVALGYTQFDAAKAVAKVEKSQEDTVETVLKKAFKFLY